MVLRGDACPDIGACRLPGTGGSSAASRCRHRRCPAPASNRAPRPADPVPATRPGFRTHRHDHDLRFLVEPGVLRHRLLASDLRLQYRGEPRAVLPARPISGLSTSRSAQGTACTASGAPNRPADGAREPEFDYLEHDRNALVVSGGESEFADAVASPLSCPNCPSALSQAARADGQCFPGEVMSARFTDGLLRLRATRH
jgi:hypothetical protein